ncbi:FAD-dependent oxidoreductase [Actinoplanes sp. NBRC 103695]|uniref:FAD-dependent oxidoreductase n=1 Tax=Actinoplanes sp. NBRC 103695 TaxID=3032202 RepID=UPI0024A52A9A|nr:FAD-dependent oxidoreductase [Actinoplanes sp. NBRC 103695]GLZ02067.1 FAD-binding protein [Actinoplanes sp. NBRC 103695]
MSDVVVAGSGAAGLSAAIAAAEAGARVTVLEATSLVGGTTALSSGAMWVPANHRHAGDDIRAGRRYLEALDLGDTSAAARDRFLDEAPRVTKWLEDVTGLDLSVVPLPDTHAELPGAAATPGRTLEPGRRTVPAPIIAMVRPTPAGRPPMTLAELLTGGVPAAELERRRVDGVLTGGRALITALLTAALDAGVEIRTSARATRLRTGGVMVGDELIPGRIVLATGGFERDPELSAAFLPLRPDGLIGAPGARGDGLRMAMAAGARLGSMADAWWCPTIKVPGVPGSDQPHHRILLAERARPGAVMVDQDGRRFTDESQNYCDVGRTLHAFDAGFCFPRNPSWLIFDAEHRARYPVGPLRPTDPNPPWLHHAATIGELAHVIDVPEKSLTATVQTFNEGAGRGADPAFGRGTRAFGRATGDPQAPHPTLRGLTEPPYFAVAVHAGLGGTKGGPRTDPDGRVQHVLDATVPGLYAAGNAAASPFGLAYPGMGATISLALTFGTLAGRAAATDR